MSGTNLPAVVRDLDKLLTRKSQLEQDLRKVEKQIYDLEGGYLEETANSGNVLRGWEGGYLSSGGQQKTNQKKKFKEGDRLFSLSSVTSPQSVEQALQEEDGKKKKQAGNDDDEYPD